MKSELHWFVIETRVFWAWMSLVFKGSWNWWMESGAWRNAGHSV